MAAKTDWSDGQQVTAATMNALGTEVNTKASSTELSTAIGGRQPQDTDLSTIADLSPANDDVLQRKAGAWANRTIAQLKTDLGLSGTNTGDQTTITGNAGTATKLATARTINGVSFDGTANITIADSTKEATANKGAANGYAPLDSSQLVPAVNLPSYVDDVLEYANLAGLPGTGTTGKIYVALDTGKIYRWSGSAYVEISPSPGSTDSVTEGSSNLYYTNARADARIAAATATGTGSLVRATSPTLVTPALGTPASGTLTNCTFPTLNQNTTGTASVATKWVPRVGTTTSSATPTIDMALYEQYNITALAAAITSWTISNPADGLKLIIRIKDNGTARALSFTSTFRAIGVTLPTTTVLSKTLYLGCVYNAADSKLDVIAVGQEA